MSNIIIRPAIAADQPTINAMTRAAGNNPFGLDWRRFLVADESGRVVGIGQIKPHRDGSRELASIAVIPERQGQGIAAAIIAALLSRENGPLYLKCRDELQGFYERFGFRTVEPSEMPPSFRRLYRLVQWITPPIRLFVKDLPRLAVMRRIPENSLTP
jgi:N-acetylglutamate synthase-like GNAT family acetyltransferase